MHVLRLTFLALLMYAATPAHLADAKSRRVNAPVSFHLTLSKADYTRNEPIEATLSLKNNGSKPVWVNTRFYINAPTQPPEERDVTLDVTGPDGKLLTTTYSYQTGFPKSDYFQLLPGGQTAKAEHPRDLRSYFQFQAPGRYTVVATYENVFGPELGLPAFTGPAKSKPVTLTVTE